MTDRPSVIVVGGGLAGLVAARHLAAGGADVTLVERRDRVGGRVATRERDGYRFDRGFQVLFTAYPAVRRELDLDGLDLRRFAPGACLARPSGRSTLADPLREPRALPATLRNTDVTVGDKLRVLRLRLALGRTDFADIFEGPDGDIEAFLAKRGFSARFRNRFAAPFLGGITLDRSLSTSARVFRYVYKALAEGHTAVPASGMGAIPAQLARGARRAGATIETDTAVDRLEPAAETVDGAGGTGGVELSIGGETRLADAAVVATEPPTARELTAVDAIPTDGRGCVTQYYALPGGELDVGRRLVLNADPPSERGEGEAWPNHVVPHSAVAPSYSPDDVALVSATYLGVPNATDAALAERSRRALESWFPARRFDGLERLHTDRIPFAQFDQPPGIHDRLPDVRAPDGPVYLAGEYTRWSSIQGAMASGRDAAATLLADLGSG
ncbi:phytoene dehydrogenase-like oxidoreductase [Halovivax ruber XH-70]|uniref:Phytoene dehydrogenase-like oxidoreductase n=1 Tax=Halovivax ruber (strain DSM 18193 / JCM 13892 / XH-70) TaxID=797302 RepID=L0I984_HALRX|nr:NAD(P)/FAD-dependent oxidoreductase [Halovivax ruber]AGB15368.1 phytoene dehydrogenase-like oxidoreductase [Halovivax ruber XH-70]